MPRYTHAMALVPQRHYITSRGRRYSVERKRYLLLAAYTFWYYSLADRDVCTNLFLWFLYFSAEGNIRCTIPS